MENKENELVKNERVDVDMTKYLSDKGKEFRSKLRDCQYQMDYLMYKYSLFLEVYNQTNSEYRKYLGVPDEKKQV